MAVLSDPPVPVHVKAPESTPGIQSVDNTIPDTDPKFVPFGFVCVTVLVLISAQPRYIPFDPSPVPVTAIGDPVVLNAVAREPKHDVGTAETFTPDMGTAERALNPCSVDEAVATIVAVPGVGFAKYHTSISINPVL